MRFAWATGTALLGVLLLGWLTGLRGVMHALLIAIGAAASLPFALVLALVALVAAASLASTLLAEDSGLAGAGAGAMHDSRWQRAFHTQVARQRQRPLAWGFAVGGLLGVVGVWLVLAALVIPLETRTLGILRLARARLSSSTLASALPSADAILRPSAWSSASGEADEPVLDAFGHPLAREGGGAAGEFTLRSLGLDGVASGDDLCASGRAGDGAAAVGESLRFVEDLRADRLGWSALFAAIEGARCSTR